MKSETLVGIFVTVFLIAMLIIVVLQSHGGSVQCQLCGYDGSHFYRGARFCYEGTGEDVKLIPLDEVTERCININAKD